MRRRFTVAVRNYEKLGQGESKMFCDIRSGDQTTYFMFCVFRNTPSIDLIMHEIGEGNHAECDVRDRNVLERSACKSTLDRGSEWLRIIDDGLMKAASRMAKSV